MKASDVLNGITKAKRSQARLLRYVIDTDPALGQKVNWCGSWLYFREWIQVEESRLLNANFCKKHLLCQACAVRRAAKMYEAYLPKVQQVMIENPHAVGAMVTLTLRNGPDLAERIQHIKASWSDMLTAKRKANGSCRHSPVEWNKVLGSLRALEITYGKGGWHVHMHIFVLLDCYISQKKLVEEWERFTGDSFIVGITQCHNGPQEGLLEVLKYSCKFSSMTPEQVLETHRTCKGHRLIDPQCLLRGVPEPDIDSDEISPDLSGPYRDFIAKWVHANQKYHIEFLPEPDALRVRPKLAIRKKS